MEEVILEQKDAADWIYRGEGAVNLVLAYTGSSPFLAAKVLRIQKVHRGRAKYTQDASTLSFQECLLWQDTNGLASSPTREMTQHLYVQNVMSPLLGAKHVDCGMRVCVSRDFLESVDKKVCLERPAWRAEAAKINFLSDTALLMSDHSVVPRGMHQGEPCICVEIKPKCGFLPSSRYIAQENAVKRTTSRFRMHQFLKLYKKEISNISDYDPLDLHSQAKDRIHKAIKALFATPQNNLRVFLNGLCVFGGLGGRTDNTSVSSEALENILMHVIQAEAGLRTEIFIELVAEALFRSQVLNLLLKVQKLDTFDIEGAIHAYYDVVSQPCMVCRVLGEDQASAKYAALHSIPFKESVAIVRDYLIAATAKDCGLMISFRPREDGNERSLCSNIYLESTNQCFEYKASFIDLDMKPLKKMEYYYMLDQEIVNCYILKAVADHAQERASSVEQKTENHYNS